GLDRRVDAGDGGAGHVDLGDRGARRVLLLRRPRAVFDARGGLLLGRRAGTRRQACREYRYPDCSHGLPPVIHYFMNGPQAGSRTSPADTESLCLMRPSAETAESTPRPPLTVASRIMRPLGAKLGDSSLSLSVRIWVWRLAKSSVATWNLPPLRAMNARRLPSGLILGDTL